MKEEFPGPWRHLNKLGIPFEVLVTDASIGEFTSSLSGIIDLRHNGNQEV